MMHNISTQKDLFHIEEGLTYLNCASMSPMLKAVKEAGLKALETRAAPWNIVTEDWFANAEKIRVLAGNIFQTSGDNIAIIPSASYGLAAAAKNLICSARKEIIILEHEYPSNYYVWENLASKQGLKIVVIQKTKDKTLTECILEKINKNTGIVAISNCHWITGMYVDLQQVSTAVKTVGAYFVLDLSQSLGVLPINIDAIQPDVAVSVGYKWLMGPYSLGYMYVSKKWQEIGEPLEYTRLAKKGSEDFTKITNYVTDYKDGARKFDMGEVSQFNLLPMAVAALQQVNQWGVGYIQAEISKLAIAINDFKKELNIFDETALSVAHILSIPLEKLDVHKLKITLGNLKVVVGFRENVVRVSPHVYNNTGDIEKLISCLQ